MWRRQQLRRLSSGARPISPNPPSALTHSLQSLRSNSAPASWPLTARLLRGAGGGTGSRGHSSSSSVRRRERERDSCWLLLSSAGEAAPSAEERLLFSSCLLLAPCVQPGAGSERWESGRQLLGVTRQSSLRQPLPSSDFETYWRQPAGNNTTKMPN